MSCKWYFRVLNSICSVYVISAAKEGKLHGGWVREENKYFSGRGFPPSFFGLSPIPWLFAAAKTIDLSWKKDMSAAGAGALCTSLQHQPPGTLPVLFRLRKPFTSGTVMSSFHSLDSRAGVKPLNSYTVLWVAGSETLKTAFPYAFFL